LAVNENALLPDNLAPLLGGKKERFLTPQTPFEMTDFRVCCD
jgi:hypothetical protein